MAQQSVILGPFGQIDIRIAQRVSLPGEVLGLRQRHTADVRAPSGPRGEGLRVSEEIDLLTESVSKIVATRLAVGSDDRHDRAGGPSRAHGPRGQVDGEL